MRRPSLILVTTAALCVSAPMLGSAGAQSPTRDQAAAAAATGTGSDAQLRGAIGTAATGQAATPAARKATSTGAKGAASRNAATAKTATSDSPDTRGRSANPQAKTDGSAGASGEYDPNLPGVRLPARGAAVNRPVAHSGAEAAPSGFAVPAPRTLSSGVPAREDQDGGAKARRLWGGGVTTGDVSIGGPLGAGPINSSSAAGRW